MAFESKLGQGMLEAQHQSYSGPLRVDAAATNLKVYQNYVYISNSTGDDAAIYLPPVAAARGRYFVFYQEGSGTQSVLIRPQGWISSGTLAGGDSSNWDGGNAGYDMDTQYDHLVLYSTGVMWVEITDADGGIA